jgi:hypothetical protein
MDEFLKYVSGDTNNPNMPMNAILDASAAYKFIEPPDLVNKRLVNAH